MSVMKWSSLGLLMVSMAVSSAFASGDPTLATYYIGVDKATTPRNGTDGNPYANNPNNNRLTMLYAHSYVGNVYPTKVINHYHPLGAYRYTGPSTAPGITFSNARTPEGANPPLTLRAGTGVFSGLMVSNLGSPTSSTYDRLAIRSIESLRSGAGPIGTAPSTPFSYNNLNPANASFDAAWNSYLESASGAWLMLNSSPLTTTFADNNGAYSTSVASTTVGMQLVDLTAGLNIYSTTGTPLFTGGIGSTETLGLLDSLLSFEPVFGTSVAGTNQNIPFEAKFKLVDLSSSPTFGDSGEFRYSFQLAAIPEPTSMLLLGAAGSCIVLRRQRVVRRGADC